MIGYWKPLILLFATNFWKISLGFQCITVNTPKLRTFSNLNAYHENTFSFDATKSTYGGNFVKIIASHDKLKKNDFTTNESNYVMLLSLENTSLKIIESGTFLGLRCLKTLELQDNEIEHIAAGAFGGLARLYSLDLSNNSLKALRNGVFEGLTNLRVLNLTNNVISTIAEQAFTCVPTLNVLNISYNHLTFLKLEFWHKTQNLHVLDVSHNLVNKFNFTTNATNLRSLMLHHNKLETIDANELSASCPLLTHITMHENPWSCNDLSKIITTLNGTKIRLDTQIDVFDCVDYSKVKTGAISSTLGVGFGSNPPDVQLNAQAISSLTFVVVFLFVFMVMFAGYEVWVRGGLRMKCFKCSANSPPAAPELALDDRL